MRGNRLISLANDFYENSDRTRSNEYEERYRIESKLRAFEREVWNEAMEDAAMLCDAAKEFDLAGMIRSHRR